MRDYRLHRSRHGTPRLGRDTLTGSRGRPLPFRRRLLCDWRSVCYDRVGRAADLRPGACDAAVVAFPRTERLRRVGSRQATHHLRAHYEPDLAVTRAVWSFVAHRLERSGVPDRCRGQRPGTDGVPAPRWNAALAAARAGGEPGEGPHVQQPGRLHAGHRRRARVCVLRLVRAAGLRLCGQGNLAEAAPGAPYPVPDPLRPRSSSTARSSSSSMATTAAPR